MDEQELLKERFKSAVTSAVKVISENFDLQIQFGNHQTTKKNRKSGSERFKNRKIFDFMS